MTHDDQIKRMVERFLMWRLPEHFNPDAGISFDPVFNKGTKHEMRHQPCGTNLFDYEQAKAMVQYMIEGLDQALSERIAVLEGENTIARAVIAEANNSLFGSQSYFVTTAKGEVAGAVGVTDEPDKYHLASPIERLKRDSRHAYKALREMEDGRSNDALDTLRASLIKEGSDVTE